MLIPFIYTIAEIFKKSIYFAAELIDTIACSTYETFSSKCKIPALSKEWTARAKEEKDHILFWEKALILSKQKQLPLIFQNHRDEIDKLLKIKQKISRIFSEFKSYDVPSKTLSIASLLEIYMLSPAFTTMFHDYRFIDANIEKNYGKHLLQFMNMTKKFHGELNSLHIELLNETLYDLYNANKNLLINSEHDSLTGIYNRRGFFTNAKTILSLAERKSVDVGIIMIDFDDFKNINDTLGHPAGDRVLKEVSSIIKSNLRGSCTFARYGGDEFVILSDIDNVESLKVICERIRKNIDEASEDIAGVYFTISLGAATGTINKHPDQSLAKIINKADQNLYKAKKKGKIVGLFNLRLMHSKF